MLAVPCKTLLQSVLIIPDLIFKNGLADLDLVYNASDAYSSLFTPDPFSPSVCFSLGVGLTSVDMEERIHHPLILIQRLCPVV